jgi:hypothetical protein
MSPHSDRVNHGQVKCYAVKQAYYFHNKAYELRSCYSRTMKYFLYKGINSHGGATVTEMRA